MNNNVNTTSENLDDKIDINAMPNVVDRVNAGLIGTLLIDNDINKPIIKKGDYVNIKASSKLSIGDIVLYSLNDEYFIRRILKYTDNGLFVAGDDEKYYHVIEKSNIKGKVISRERKNKVISFSLTPKNKLYTFNKIKLQYFRIKNRIINKEQETLNESLEIAKTSTKETKQPVIDRIKALNININPNLDNELKSFIDPDSLVLELQNANNNEQNVNNNVDDNLIDDSEVENVVEETLEQETKESLEIKEETSEEIDTVSEESY